MPFAATWMDPEIVVLSEISQTEMEKYRMSSLLSRILKERTQMNLPNRKRLTDLANLRLPRGGEGTLREFGMDMYTLLYLKWTTNKDLLYSTKNSAQQLCGNLDGRGVWGRMDTCICMAESLHCSPETTTILLISYNPIQNKKFKV